MYISLNETEHTNGGDQSQNYICPNSYEALNEFYVSMNYYSMSFSNVHVNMYF